MARRVKLWTSACGVICTGEVAVLFTTWMWCSYLLISVECVWWAPLTQNPLWVFVRSMFKWTGHDASAGISGTRPHRLRLRPFMWRVIFIYFWCKMFLWYIIFVGVFFFFFRVVFFKCQGSDSVRTGLNQLFTLRRCSEYYFSQPLKLRKSCLKGFRTRSAFFFFSAKLFLH